MTKKYKTPPMSFDTPSKLMDVRNWLHDDKRNDKVGWTSYNGRTTFYFDEAEDYFMFMMNYYD
jgi:hypothetical protein